MPYMECKLCEKEFSGPESYAQHLICKAHLQKVEEKGIDKTLFVENGAASKGQYKCDACNVDLSGPVPLEQHYNGSKHKSMLNKQRILHERGSKNSNDEQSISLTCSTCGKVFSGPESYEDHMKSKKHQRKVEMEDTKARLNNQEPPTCPPALDEDNSHQGFYPSLPKPEPAVGPVRAYAQKEVHRKTKKPPGCFTALRLSLKKKNKKQK